MNVRVQGFTYQGDIPALYTCDGEDVNPEITIFDIPEHARDVAFVVDDPDASGGNTFTHWVVWNLPLQDGQLVIPARVGVDFGVQGVNSAGKIGYMGPCPGNGKAHRYFFTAYALSQKISLPATTPIAQFYETIRPFVIARAEYMGMYQRLPTL